MKKNFKRIVSLLLCLVILCCPFANVMQPAHANPIAWVAGSSVLEFIAFVLGVLGITFASQGDMLQASNQYLSSNPAITTKLTELLDTAKSEVNGTYKLQIGATLFLYLKNTVIPSVLEYFGRTKTSISIADINQIIVNKIKATTNGYKPYVNAELAYDSAYYSMSLYNSASTALSMNFNGNVYKFYIDNWVNSQNPNMRVLYLMASSPSLVNFSYVNNSSTSQHYCSEQSNYITNFSCWIDAKIGFRYMTVGATKYLYPYLAYKYLLTNGTVGYGVSDSNFPTVMATIFGVVENATVPIPYDYDIDYSNSEFMNALEKIYQAILGLGTTLTLPWDRPVEDVEQGKQEVENKVEGKPYWPEWAMWWEKLGIKDLIDTVTQSKTITESDVKMPELPVSIKDKFPFCVPFDVYYMIEKLNAPSAAPSWNIPFKIQSLGINQTIPLDLSGWESVAAVCRWANVLLFILALVLLTRNIIRA